MKLGKGAFIVLSLISFLFILVSCGDSTVECSHEWTDFVVEKEANCIISGLKVKECKKCHLEVSEVISASHHYVEDGVYYISDEYPVVTVHTCSVCGSEDLEINSEKATYKEVEVTNKLVPTCKAKGHSSSVVCEGVVIKPLVELDFTEHKYELITRLEPTCTEAGREEYLCSICNDLHHERITALSHDYVVNEEKLATCLEEGNRFSTCARCGDQKHEVLEILPHDIVVNEATEATCTEDGYSEEIFCAECHQVFKSSVKVADALGHDLDPETITVVEPTCLEQGHTTGWCNRCEQYTKIDHEALGHKYIEGKAECEVCHYKHYTEGLIYELSADGKYYILTGVQEGFDDEILSIPAEYENLPIKEIKAESFKGAKYKYLYVGENVTTIGANAFEGCSNLEQVYLSKSVQVIENSAFINAESLKLFSIKEDSALTTIGVCAFTRTALETFYVPASLTSFGKASFYGCHNLKEINVASANKNYKSVDGNLYSKDGSTFIQYALGKTDEEFTIPTSVTKIADLAFASSKYLTNVKLHQNVSEVGFYAFRDSQQLTVELATSSKPEGFDENFAYLIKEVKYQE